MEKNYLKNQKRNKRRGILERSRFKKFQFLKHTNQMEDYYNQKRKFEKPLEYKVKLSLWQRIKNWFKRKRKTPVPM